MEAPSENRERDLEENLNKAKALFEEASRLFEKGINSKRAWNKAYYDTLRSGYFWLHGAIGNARCMKIGDFPYDGSEKEKQDWIRLREELDVPCELYEVKERHYVIADGLLKGRGIPISKFVELRKAIYTEHPGRKTSKEDER